MRYLLITHVPFGRGSGAGRVAVRDMWLEDLSTQAAALREAGMTLAVAAPLVDRLAPQGSSVTLEIEPAEKGFTYLPLPPYYSLMQFLRVRGPLRRALREAIGDADIVQMGYGGHPVPLGAVAWHIAGDAGRKRIWMFDGGDPFPQWRLHAQRIGNPVKRSVRLYQLGRLEKFMRRAIADADVVIAHNHSVVERFKDVWHDACHQFHRTFVTRSWLIDDAHLARRQAALRDRTGPLQLVIAGRQVAIKGTDHVLRAMAAALAQGARLELEVIGTGPELPKYEALARELKLEQHVRFRGAMPYGEPLREAWERRHVLVVTNLTSEFSRNLLLGMARGLPLITYSNPGDAIVQASDAGIVVPMGDENALASAMVSADRDRERLAQLAERGLGLVSNMTLEECHRRRAAIAANALGGIGAGREGSLADAAASAG